LARLLVDGKRTVIVTGAGISVASGVRPFRGPNGICVENQWSYTTKATSRTFSAECPAGGLSGIRPLILNKS
jgi:NAD-dependent SIR2 family protein deacetylase